MKRYSLFWSFVRIGLVAGDADSCVIDSSYRLNAVSTKFIGMSAVGVVGYSGYCN